MDYCILYEGCSLTKSLAVYKYLKGTGMPVKLRDVLFGNFAFTYGTPEAAGKCFVDLCEMDASVYLENLEDDMLPKPCALEVQLLPNQEKELGFQIMQHIGCYFNSADNVYRVPFMDISTRDMTRDILAAYGVDSVAVDW